MGSHMSGLHLKRLHVDSDSFIIWLGPNTLSERGHPRICEKGLGIHVEVPWSRCVKEFDAPPRINLHLYNWFVIIAYGREGKSQAWSRKGVTERWRWITWHPNRDLQCRAKYVGTHFGQTREWECSRLKGHKGDHG